MEMIFCDKGKNKYNDQLWSVNFIDSKNNFVGLDNVDYALLSIIQDGEDITGECMLDFIACDDVKKLKYADDLQEYSLIKEILKDCVFVEHMRTVREDGILLSQYYTIKIKNIVTDKFLYMILSFDDSFNYYGDITNFKISLNKRERECEHGEQLSMFKNKEWNKLKKFDVNNCKEV